jgi:hypothetical protein
MDLVATNHHSDRAARLWPVTIRWLLWMNQLSQWRVRIEG